MNFKTIKQWANEKGIGVDLFPLHAQKALVIEMNGKFHIALAENLTEEEKCICLLHELGHVMTGTLYKQTETENERMAKEIIASQWAITTELKFRQ